MGGFKKFLTTPGGRVAMILFFAGVVYFIVKGFLAVAIGLVVAPFQLAKMISNSVSDHLTIV